MPLGVSAPLGRLIARIFGSHVRGGSAISKQSSSQCVRVNWGAKSINLSANLYVHSMGCRSRKNVSSLSPS